MRAVTNRERVLQRMADNQDDLYVLGQPPEHMEMELGSNEAIKQAVAGGLGIAVLSAHTLAPECSAEDLVLLDVEGFPIRRHWYIAYPKDKQLSVVALAFPDFLHKESKLLGEHYLRDIPGVIRNDQPSPATVRLLPRWSRKRPFGPPPATAARQNPGARAAQA